MKNCEECGEANADDAAQCGQCGAEFASARVSEEDVPQEPGPEGRLENIATLDNEIQAELVDAVLSDRKIPHLMRTYHDSALDGIFQGAKGWGAILAPREAKAEILAILASIKRQASSSDAPEDPS